MNTLRYITILGSTGSIGQSALDVIGRHPDRYRVVALTANKDVDALEKQCLHWRQLGGLQQVQRGLAQAGVGRLQSGDQVGPKARGIVVVRVQREPGNAHAWSTLAGPLAQQRGLARSSRGGKQG